MKLKEYIEYLKMLPQDLLVMECSDEFGVYSAKEKPPQVIEVVKSTMPLSSGEERVKYEDFDANYEIFNRRQVISI